MPIEVPKKNKVTTTTYSNFKGVDYTNDPTNVWYRRSPSGVNMLPDASGRPFKRNGWETVITADDLLALLEGEEDTKIYRCFYFELGGLDHIVIFAEGGVFVYKEDLDNLEEASLELMPGSNDIDCYKSYDRAFFFEGDGTSAFYIYGNFKIWKYGIEGFGLVDATIPTVLFSATADGVGETLQSYNMLSNKANIEYTNNDLFYHTTSADITASVVKETFVTKVSDTRGIYEFTYSTDHWELNSTTVTMSEYGIEVLFGTPETDDTITVIYKWGVLLPINVTQKQVEEHEVSVYATRLAQFGYELNVLTEETEGSPNSPSATDVVLHTDTTSYHDTDVDLRRAWIEFVGAEPVDYGTANYVDDGEDKIRVTVPITEVDITNYEEESGSGQAVIDRGQVNGNKYI